jgi:SAM-dependent methyltransferase
MAQEGERPSVALRRLIDGYQVSQALHVASTLGIADLLADGPRTSDDLAAATETDPRALYRVLRALASVGVFHEEAEGRFSLTELGGCLRSDAPESLAGWAAFIGRPYYWQAWGDLLHSVRTGENAFRHVHGTDPWSYRARHAEESAIFDRAMTGVSRQNTQSAVAAYDFGQFRRIVDVGGGQGALLAATLAKHPHISGVLFDQPHVVARAQQVLEAAGVMDRCEVVGGDFFVVVPEGDDAYLLRAVLHDWADEEATAILRTCRRAMGPDARLLVLEWVLAGPNEGRAAKFSDLNMLVSPGGQERTREEYAALFAAAGFRLTEITPTALGPGVIEGIPI